MSQDLFSFPFEKISNDLLCKATSNENSDSEKINLKPYQLLFETTKITFSRENWMGKTKNILLR